MLELRFIYLKEERNDWRAGETVQELDAASSSPNFVINLSFHLSFFIGQIGSDNTSLAWLLYRAVELYEITDGKVCWQGGKYHPNSEHLHCYCHLILPYSSQHQISCWKLTTLIFPFSTVYFAPLLLISLYPMAELFLKWLMALIVYH